VSRDLADGLAPDRRYRCAGCGNLTRFDVEVVERTRRFLHADLSGVASVEREEVLAREVEAVICHWCGTGEHVAVEAAPGAAPTPDG